MALILLIKQTNTTNEHFCESNIHTSGVKHSLIYLAFTWLQHRSTTGLPRGNSRFKSKLYRVPFGISLFIPSFPSPFSFLHFFSSPYLSTPPTHIFFLAFFFNPSFLLSTLFFPTFLLPSFPSLFSPLLSSSTPFSHSFLHPPFSFYAFLSNSYFFLFFYPSFFHFSFILVQYYYYYYHCNFFLCITIKMITLACFICDLFTLTPGKTDGDP